jgi:peptide/nickel transport system ATP-binding protein
MAQDVLRVQGLVVHYHTPLGAVKAANDITFNLHAEERLGLVGESGSGKSTLALAILRMIKPPGRIEAGEIWLEGGNLMTLSEEEMRLVRLARIAMIPQGSMNSLNPVIRIRAQMADALRDHGVQMPRRQMDERIRGLLLSVGLRPDVADMYPHELSGGMKQRACIAIAISLRPKVIIADEPTSALDVVVQKQVMETLARVQKELAASVILVGHDMGLVAQFVDRLGVMYAGKLVEVSPVKDIFTKPLHPYTQMLIASLPSFDQKGTFRGIPGLPPLLRNLPPGCAFHPRCPQAIPRCQTDVPPFREARPDSGAACHLLP